MTPSRGETRPQASRGRPAAGTGLLLAALCAGCLAAPSAQAQEGGVQLGGYLKDLGGWFENPGRFFPRDVGKVQNSLEDRLKFGFIPTEALSFEVEAWSRFITQKRFNPGGTYASSLDNQDALVDLGVTPINEQSAILHANLDRLWIDWSPGPLQVTAGRQRIAWGTALVWNPTDVFNPYAVLDFDYEERPGTDALRLQYYTGPLSKIEIAAAPARRIGRSTVAGLYRWNTEGYDFSILGGLQRKGWFAGLNWAGQISGGGFRGEALYRRVHVDQLTLPPGDMSQGSVPRLFSNPYLSIALSGDYTFPGSLYLHTEVLFNGDGAVRDAGQRWLLAQLNGELAPARYSIYQECSYDITPLVRGSVFAIINPSDGSLILVPSFTWSMFTDWDLLCIALLAGGDPGTEYGDFGKSVFVRVKWSY